MDSEMNAICELFGSSCKISPRASIAVLDELLDAHKGQEAEKLECKRAKRRRHRQNQRQNPRRQSPGGSARVQAHSPPPYPPAGRRRQGSPTRINARLSADRGPAPLKRLSGAQGIVLVLHDQKPRHNGPAGDRRGPARGGYRPPPPAASDGARARRSTLAVAVLRRRQDQYEQTARRAHGSAPYYVEVRDTYSAA